MAVAGVDRVMTAGEREQGIAGDLVRADQADLVRVDRADLVRVDRADLVQRGRRAVDLVRRENAGGRGRRGRRGEIVRRETAGNSGAGRGGRVRRVRSISVGRVRPSGRVLLPWKAGKRGSWRILVRLKRWRARSRRRAGHILFSMWRGCFCRIGHGIW